MVTKRFFIWNGAKNKLGKHWISKHAHLRLPRNVNISVGTVDNS